MKLNKLIINIKYYLKELTIVTIGVLIALLVSNFKEDNQARLYHDSSIQTINKEVIANNSNLEWAIEKHINLLDAIKTYNNDTISIGNLFSIAGGLQFASIGNIGLEFYTRNQVNSIDFEMMAILINMNALSELIHSKTDKLMDYIYLNIFNKSEEKKILTAVYLSDILEIENQLKLAYEKFIDEYIETKHDTE